MMSKIINVCQCLIYQFILALININYFTKLNNLTLKVEFYIAFFYQIDTEFYT